MSSFKTAALCDEFASELEVCLAQFRTFGGRRSFSGEIQTVSTFEDVEFSLRLSKLAKEGFISREAIRTDRLSS